MHTCPRYSNARRRVMQLKLSPPLNGSPPDRVFNTSISIIAASRYFCTLRITLTAHRARATESQHSSTRPNVPSPSTLRIVYSSARMSPKQYTMCPSGSSRRSSASDDGASSRAPNVVVLVVGLALGGIFTVTVTVASSELVVVVVVVVVVAVLCASSITGVAGVVIRGVAPGAAARPAPPRDARVSSSNNTRTSFSSAAARFALAFAASHVALAAAASAARLLNS
mmetsp:Transcript_7478/g.27295  ORF Transcript_7478/g.27295 Transcript_7478/m.27295 type:complete len:226 (-) Transcript_7478:748-1425(-)